MLNAYTTSPSYEHASSILVGILPLISKELEQIQNKVDYVQNQVVRSPSKIYSWNIIQVSWAVCSKSKDVQCQLKSSSKPTPFITHHPIFLFVHS